jgi:hypothetical protein
MDPYHLPRLHRFARWAQHQGGVATMNSKDGAGPDSKKTAKNRNLTPRSSSGTPQKSPEIAWELCPEHDAQLTAAVVYACYRAGLTVEQGTAVLILLFDRLEGVDTDEHSPGLAARPWDEEVLS